MSGSVRAQPEQLAELQARTANIRNFCILAHVDHGKTTLTDSLVSSNGIISAKMAGKLRYLDSTEEEQRRGITMQSSAISLLFRNKVERAEDSSRSSEGEDYLINLIDSPGHIDFSSDVSTATRLCDGAIIVIDAVEGICTQTHAVIYKALKERLKPLLVLNKIDRLCVEMKLSSTEAFYHLRRLLEQINALSFTLLNSEIMKRRVVGGADQADEHTHINNISNLEKDVTEANEAAVDGKHELDSAEEETDDSLVADWIFAPEQGNVIFASAIDCWGFGVARFTTLWAKRLGVNRNVLRKYIFEDYMFNSNTKKIVRCDPSRGSNSGGSKPMFASMILDPLWQLYDTAVVQQDVQKLLKMAQKAMMIELPPREVNTRDTRATLQSILRRWLPLSDTILRSVVRVMPCPSEAQMSRLFTLLPNVKESDESNDRSGTSIHSTSVVDTENKILRCDNSMLEGPRTVEINAAIGASIETVTQSIALCNASSAAPVVVFVSKTVAIRAGELAPRDLQMLNRMRQEKANAEPESDLISATNDNNIRPDDEVFLALGRVFSGILRRDTVLYVLGSRYNPYDAYDSTTIQRVDDPASDAASKDLLGMYIMLGPSVHPVSEVPAGNVVGILGLDEYILKSATLCSEWAAHPMTAITFQAKPMVKVAVEPFSHQHLRQVAIGLKRLHQFDPVVEVATDDNTGQSTMTCLGELHLEQCVKALTERFAKCALKISEPIVSYRETVIGNDSIEGGTGSVPSATKYLPPPWGDLPEISMADNGRYRILHISNNLAIHLRCFPIPTKIADVMEASLDDSSTFIEVEASLLRGKDARKDDMSLYQNSFWSKMSTVLCASNASSEESDAIDPSLICLASQDNDGQQSMISELRQWILALGSKLSTNCLLLFSARNIGIHIWNLNSLRVDTTAGHGFEHINHDISKLVGKACIFDEDNGLPSPIFWKLWNYLHSAVVAGYRLACDAGPLMHEPLHRVGFCIEKVEITHTTCAQILNAQELGQLIGGDQSNPSDMLIFEQHICEETSSDTAGSDGIIIGQLISELREGMSLCVLSAAARVVEPVYRCDIQCDQMQLGNLYAVLSQRRGSVVDEDVIEGSSLFLLTAHLPLQASFGFAQHLLDKTSGLATAPQLQLSHWTTMDMDPFWRPRTEEELEEFGDLTAVISAQAGQERMNINLPRAIIDAVRKRKGLQVEEKIVNFAEKQRTLNKKK